MTKLYVGNLSYSESEQSLSEMFGDCGSVESVKIIMDQDTGKSKGFGFVEMSTDEEAKAAISKWDGTERSGRSIKVNAAKPREKREGGYSQGGGRGRY
ncbi:MAG: RNA-binding protein [Deltaproteobacteria bacterium CG11_big_fil_rev_8_21_14_0_20_45_16]|nr:MAG: RNA-binding protein [Deltaproteobacteria bacterium CG11_big_fil_rev_8_21_14_0_20_45_16]